MTVVILGERIRQGQAQIIPPLVPRAVHAAVAVSGGLASEEPIGVLPARSDRRAGS